MRIRVDPMRQIVRQLDILRTLRAQRYGITVRELGDEYGVTVRTVQRDLNDLRAAGFILGEERRDDQHVYYQLQKEIRLPLNFPVMEIAAMIFAERSGLGLVGTPFGEHLHSAVRRLTDAMSPEMRQFLERAAEAYVPLDPRPQAVRGGPRAARKTARSHSRNAASAG